MAHFLLHSAQISRAVRHRTVEEIWYVLSGQGEMWRSAHDSNIAPLAAGTCLTIPAGTAFQFRCTSPEPLTAIGVTMPPWPGEDEAEIVTGAWDPTPPPSRHR
jgi:mannose-6-phosphate isomerase-like protein (cupin superfamily)